MAFSLVGAERWELGHFLVLATRICESCIRDVLQEAFSMMVLQPDELASIAILRTDHYFNKSLCKDMIAVCL